MILFLWIEMSVLSCLIRKFHFKNASRWNVNSDEATAHHGPKYKALGNPSFIFLPSDKHITWSSILCPWTVWISVFRTLLRYSLCVVIFQEVICGNHISRGGCFGGPGIKTRGVADACCEIEHRLIQKSPKPFYLITVLSNVYTSRVDTGTFAWRGAVSTLLKGKHILLTEWILSISHKCI